LGPNPRAPIINEERLRRVRDEVLVPVINGMKKEGHPFTGILYAGIIVRNNDIKVLEFNVRFGDPETQVLLPLLKNKFGDIIEASINKNLNKKILEFLPHHAITVVMASGGYPGNYEKGKIIQGLDAVEKYILVFHAGTQSEGDRILTSGGRVLNITTCAESLQKARERVYDEINKISFDGAFYRTDIAHRAIKVK
jgi:phosphoribosylamine--glycine ligase